MAKIFCYFNGDGSLIIYLFSCLDWVNQMCTKVKNVNPLRAPHWLCISMSGGAWDWNWAWDYILLSWGVSKREQKNFTVRWFYWSAQTIRVVSQIYREQNNRGNVSQSENTDVTITDKTDWTILGLYLWLVCSLLWFGMAKEVPLNKTFAVLLV